MYQADFFREGLKFIDDKINTVYNKEKIFNFFLTKVKGDNVQEKIKIIGKRGMRTYLFINNILSEKDRTDLLMV